MERFYTLSIFCKINQSIMDSGYYTENGVFLIDIPYPAAGWSA